MSNGYPGNTSRSPCRTGILAALMSFTGRRAFVEGGGRLLEGMGVDAWR